MLIGGPSCSLLCRPVELNAQGPRHTVTDMDSYAHHAYTIVGHDLAQQLEERTAVKILLVLHDSPLQERLVSTAPWFGWLAGV